MFSRKLHVNPVLENDCRGSFRHVRRFRSIFASISWIFQPPGQYGGRAVHLGSFGSKHLGLRTQDDRVIQSLQMRAISNGSIDYNPHTVSGLSGQETFKFRKLMHLILGLATKQFAGGPSLLVDHMNFGRFGVTVGATLGATLGTTGNGATVGSCRGVNLRRNRWNHSGLRAAPTGHLSNALAIGEGLLGIRREN